MIIVRANAIKSKVPIFAIPDYLMEGKWTSVAVDNIILKMSKDEVLYLHNYKDKFTQLGLQWANLNDNEVTILSIPEAILGKNLREVIYHCLQIISPVKLDQKICLKLH